MYIAIDIGGTNMRIALMDLSEKESIVKMESHRINQDYTTGIEEMSAYIDALAKGQDIQGIGACFPGIVDENGLVMNPNNLPDWGMKPIKETLEKRFKVPVKVIHDVQGAAIGEALYGVARGNILPPGTFNRKEFPGSLLRGQCFGLLYLEIPVARSARELA